MILILKKRETISYKKDVFKDKYCIFVTFPKET